MKTAHLLAGLMLFCLATTFIPSQAKAGVYVGVDFGGARTVYDSGPRYHHYPPPVVYAPYWRPPPPPCPPPRWQYHRPPPHRWYGHDHWRGHRHPHHPRHRHDW